MLTKVAYYYYFVCKFLCNILRNDIIDELPFSILLKDATSMLLTEYAQLMPLKYRNSEVY
jgi:hypothetical protein